MYSVTQIYKKAGHTLWVLACGIILFAGHADLAAAQTKSARGINTSSSSIGAMAPELGNLESEVLETVTLMEDIENCAQNSRFFDTNTGGCRTTDPANVEFEQDADSTTVEVQRPDGTSVRYSLDGADGVATNAEGESDTPATPEPEPNDDCMLCYTHCTSSTAVSPWGSSGTCVREVCVRAGCPG